MKSIMGAAAAAAISLCLAGCAFNAGTAIPSPTPTPTPTQPLITKARDSCNVTDPDYAPLGDGGYSITLKGKPKYGGGLPMSDIACILKAVNVPDSVVSQMDSTRALDGMQRASWDKISASWTYHPDNGFRVILSESK
ncbi:hypothetical protein LD110_08945 [Arthrobacter sp. M4]|nr:hypothetical protein [Arthrobacter sp. M4]